MSFGIGPYGFGSYGVASEAVPSAPVADLSSSRNIDMKSRSYVMDANGGFASMDDIHQRAGLLMAFEFKEPEFIQENFAEYIEDQTRKALAPLTDGPAPAIEILSVSVVANAGNPSYRQVKFRKLATNTEGVLKAPI